MGLDQQGRAFPRQGEGVLEVTLESGADWGELGGQRGPETWVNSAEWGFAPMRWKWKCKREESCSEAKSTGAGQIGEV